MMDKVMDTLYNIRDYLRDNWVNVLAGMMIVVLIIGFMMFVASVLMPQLQARNELASQVVAAQESMARDQLSQNSLPDSLNADIATSQVRLDELAAVFMSETQAADTLNNLYRYAEQTGVNVIDLQAQTEVETAVKNVYDARIFRISVEGAVPQLLAYINQINEASIASFAIQAVDITESVDPETGVTTNALAMDFVLYTSPYAVDTAVADNIPDDELTSFIPTPMAPSTPANETASLQTQLDTAWSAENWPEALSILEQMLALAPGDAQLLQKQYAANVNDGYRLLRQQQLSEAQVRFDAAFAINPNGAEAAIGKRQVTIAMLAPQLDGLWASQNWAETIRLIEQIVAVDPNYDDMQGKLYAARVNYGFQLLDQQQPDAARTQFEQALALNPNGTEAQNGLQAITGTAPTSPGSTTYTVRYGDTLFSISRRFGTTVDAIRAANGISGNNINVNQVLIIP
ncbi:MAG: LysM peptidoglycan-binding domain-containing protein [Ardenticatenaceae bacterium]|nr:LysM peptidoglycan-binding domain-containing protein [Ardenticatenaceae bacterium]MCB9444374.1 LysM peptidoglycan-binding domain-containing protein [Ardenticatenaceae bacterium]